MAETKYYIELSYQDELMLSPKIFKYEVNKKRFNELLYQFNHYKSYKRIG